MTTVLAIDQGTSGTKALVTDPAGVVVGMAECPVRPAYLPGGGVEQDPQALLDSVLESGRQALRAAGRPVDVVSLANQGETVLAWDPVTGAALSPAVVWQDRRAESIVGPLHDARAWVAQRTGLVLDSYFSAPKMAWLRSNRTRDGVVTTTDTWLLHRLTHEFVTDASTVSRSLLTDLDTVQWDDGLLSLFDLTQERLPRIAACDEIIGTTSAFGDEVPVGGLMVDQQAALLAQGATSSGQAKCTFGTGAFLLVNTEDRAVRSRGGLSSSVAWRLRGDTAYCLDGQVFTAASAVRWLVDLGLLERAEDIDAMAGAGSAVDSDEAADAVMCVPALAGLGAPWWRSDATASFVGMSLSTRREHLVRAVVLGIAAQLAELAAVVGLDTGAPLVRLRVDGGLARSQTLMQATADLLGVPVDVYPSLHATALGVAAAGRLANDPSMSVSQAVPAWTPSRTYEPQWSADRSQNYLARWRETAAATLGPVRS